MSLNDSFDTASSAFRQYDSAFESPDQKYQLGHAVPECFGHTTPAVPLLIRPCAQLTAAGPVAAAAGAMLRGQY